MAEEHHGRLSGKASAAAEDLQRHLISIKLDRLGQRLCAVGHLDERHVTQADVAGPDFQKVPDDCRRPGVSAADLSSPVSITIGLLGNVRCAGRRARRQVGASNVVKGKRRAATLIG